MCHSEIGKPADILTLKAQFIPLGDIFGVDESHTKELSHSFLSLILMWKEVGHFQNDF